MKYQSKIIEVEAVQYRKDMGLEDGFAVYETEYPEEGHTFEVPENIDTTHMTIMQAAVKTPQWKVVSEGDWIVTLPDGRREVHTEQGFTERFRPSIATEIATEYSRTREFRGYTKEEIFRLGMVEALKTAGIDIYAVLQLDQS